VTDVPRTLLDLGGALSARQLRRALSEAEYRGLLDTREVEAVLRCGRPGSRNLRVALQGHMPQLARTLSALEERFLELCQSAGIPLPEVNAAIGRMRSTRSGGSSEWSSSSTAARLMAASRR